MPENNESAVLKSLAAVEFGNRVAVIGDERAVTAVLSAGKAVKVHTAAGVVAVTPGPRWIKRNGAQRFNLRGETGHGPRGGRKRYVQSIAAFYVDDDVTPLAFEDGAALLTAEADSHDAPVKVTGKGSATRKGTSAAQPSSATDIAALLAAIPRDTLLHALGIAPAAPAAPAPAAGQTARKVRSARQPRKASGNGSAATANAQSAEALLGL